LSTNAYRTIKIRNQSSLLAFKKFSRKVVKKPARTSRYADATVTAISLIAPVVAVGQAPIILEPIEVSPAQPVPNGAALETINVDVEEIGSPPSASIPNRSCTGVVPLNNQRRNNNMDLIYKYACRSYPESS